MLFVDMSFDFWWKSRWEKHFFPTILTSSFARFDFHIFFSRSRQQKAFIGKMCCQREILFCFSLLISRLSASLLLTSMTFSVDRFVYWNKRILLQSWNFSFACVSPLVAFAFILWFAIEFRLVFFFLCLVLGKCVERESKKNERIK